MKKINTVIVINGPYEITSSPMAVAASSPTIVARRAQVLATRALGKEVGSLLSTCRTGTDTIIKRRSSTSLKVM